MNAFDRTVAEVAEVFMFEHWMRFYFITAQDGGLVLGIPEKAMEKIRTEYPFFYGLAELMNGQPMSPERSQESICTFISMTFEQRQKDTNAVSNVLSSPKLGAELYAFNMWVEANENQLESNFLEFSKWREIYGQWRITEKGRELLSSLITGQDASSGRSQ
jgi:hypothetical protein